MTKRNRAEELNEKTKQRCRFPLYAERSEASYGLLKLLPLAVKKDNLIGTSQLQTKIYNTVGFLVPRNDKIKRKGLFCYTDEGGILQMPNFN
jgi:hypothetical protein